MAKVEVMGVSAAIELMRASVEEELERLVTQGSQAFQSHDMDAVERVVRRTRRVQEFASQLLPALESWDILGKED
jgi:hypothetical protein